MTLRTCEVKSCLNCVKCAPQQAAADVRTDVPQSSGSIYVHRLLHASSKVQHAVHTVSDGSICHTTLQCSNSTANMA